MPVKTNLTMLKNNHPMKRISLVLTLLFATLFQAFAQTAMEVDEATAYKTAQAFVASHHALRGQDLNLVLTEGLYIYNIGTQGFIVISNNTVLPPVLAWSNQGNFPDMDEAPENFSAWMAHYGEMIDFAMANGIAPEAKIQHLWDDAAQGIFGAKDAKTVNPLVETFWNQDCFYNEYCPATSGGWGWGGPCGHVYAGCVACAMAQVMKYWNHPVTGFGSHSYIHSEYGEQSANFAATTYHWDEMPAQLWGHNDAVATLMYHCGVSVNMNYSPSGSGAQSADVETALRSYFGYCGAKYRQKSSYQDEVWNAMLKAELDLSHPIYYSGSSGNSGHAFVCDGYDENDFFHFNFGWSGSGDAFYSTYDVNGYNQGQAIVMNIYPIDIQADANNIIYVSPDGVGDGSSWANATDKLQFATALSSGGGTKVWVKKGTYHGDITNSEGAFYITESNRIYGSFNGDETPDYDLTQRDFTNNATILDGMGERRVLVQEKAFSSATAAVWDGFVIQNGAVGSGAGAYLNNHVTLSNCTITDNHATMYGGGVYINSTGGMARVILNKCTFTDNSSSMGGGVCDRIGATYTNCDISHNTATTKGGGLYLYNNTEPTFKNCLFSDNSAKEGGAMYARGQFTAYNCDFVMNHATESCGGILNEDKHNKYHNCILWGNLANGSPSQMEGTSDFEYCAVQGGVSGAENINLSAENDGEEPGCFVRFNNPGSGDWSLQSRSICLNAGKPNTTGLGDTDLGGNPRIQKGCVEIGAYESCASLTHIEDETYGNYYFHGRYLNESGYYTAALYGHGCDSVVGLTLYVMEGTEEQQESPFSLWPNPTTGLLHIDANDITSIEVRNLLGQLVKRSEATEILDLEALEKGVYLLILSDKEGRKSVVRVVKE